jgi:hypothetical protein
MMSRLSRRVCGVGRGTRSESRVCHLHCKGELIASRIAAMPEKLHSGPASPSSVATPCSPLLPARQPSSLPTSLTLPSSPRHSPTSCSTTRRVCPCWSSRRRRSGAIVRIGKSIRARCRSFSVCLEVRFDGIHSKIYVCRGNSIITIAKWKVWTVTSNWGISK